MIAPFFSGNDVTMETEISHELLSEAETAWAQREWSIQHVLFPAMRLFLKPPTCMATNGTVVRVSSPFRHFCFVLCFETKFSNFAVVKTFAFCRLLHSRSSIGSSKDANQNARSSTLIMPLLKNGFVCTSYAVHNFRN